MTLRRQHFKWLRLKILPILEIYPKRLMKLHKASEERESLLMTFLCMTDPEKNMTKKPNSITYKQQRVQPKIESQQNANPHRGTELFCPRCRKRRHQIWFKIKQAANEQQLPSRSQQPHEEYWDTYQDLYHEQHKCTAYELGKCINEED